MSMTRTERRRRDAEIVRQALAGTRPSLIATAMGLDTCFVQSLVCKARQAGKPIPYFSTGPVAGVMPAGYAPPQRQTIAACPPEAAKPAPKPIPADRLTLSADDEVRLAGFVKRGIGVTQIAPMLGKTYATIIAAMDRLAHSQGRATP